MVYNGGRSNYTSAKTLCAQWTPITYRIQFFGDDGTSLLGTMNDVRYNDLTLPGADGKSGDTTVFSQTLSRDGCNFLGWSTVPGLSTAMYQAGVRYTSGLANTQDATVRLYPVWAPMENYTVTYDANGGESTMNGTVLTYDADGEIAANAFTRTGFDFKGWARSSTGLAACLGGETVRNLTSQDGGTITLYAVWAPKEVIVKLDANGGQSDSCGKATYGAALPAITVPVRTGYTFGGFYLGDNKYYDADGSAVKTAWDRDTDTTLTAKRTANRCEITFDGNGSPEGSMAGLSAEYDTPCTLTKNAFVRDSCTFRGWSRTANGAAEFSDGAAVKNLSAEDGDAAAVTITTPADSEGKFPGDTLVEFTAMAGSGSVLSSLTASVNGTIVELTAADPDEAGVSERLDTGAHEKYLTGYPDGDFRPDSTITRAEAAAVVNRMLARSGDENYIRTRLEALTRFGDLTADHWAYFEIMEAANGHAYDRLDGREYWKKP